MRKAIAILPVVSAIYPMITGAIAILPVVSVIYPIITGAIAPPSIVMMSREKSSLVPASLNARMELAANLFMIFKLFLNDLNKKSSNIYIHEENEKKTPDCHCRRCYSLQREEKQYAYLVPIW